MRKLGIDLGSKTCGIAISDSTNQIANGLCNLRYKNNNLMIIIQKLKQIFYNYDHQIDTIIIGYPKYTVSNQKCQTSLLVDKFIKLLNLAFTNVKIIKQNENYTTVMANDYLSSFELKASQRKKVIDEVAACIILQSYLDQKNSTK